VFGRADREIASNPGAVTAPPSTRLVTEPSEDVVATSRIGKPRLTYLVASVSVWRAARAWRASTSSATRS
jgi:hypothetical protein